MVLKLLHVADIGTLLPETSDSYTMDNMLVTPMPYKKVQQVKALPVKQAGCCRI